MTKLEKAREFAKPYTYLDVGDVGYPSIEEAYIKGYEDCEKENGVVWHNVADGDLPDNPRNVLDENGISCYYVKEINTWYVSYTAGFTVACPKYWCETPKRNLQESKC